MRSLLFYLILTALPFLRLLGDAGGAPAKDAMDRAWADFLERFVGADGYVKDTGNDSVSHSEGQGYAMLFAVAAGDRESFDLVWEWTRNHLAVREDALFAWKWDPEEGRVDDRNNASDGDILIAWALLRASGKWEDRNYLRESRPIIRDIRRLLLKETPLGLVLIPGLDGFEREDGWIVNLSYWIFPAFLDFARVDFSNAWSEVYATGIRLMREARFSDLQLPPDWLGICNDPDDPLYLPEDFPAEFGYNAVRIPIHFVWAGAPRSPLLAPFRRLPRLSSESDQPPSTFSLPESTGGDYPAPTGFLVTYSLLDLLAESADPTPEDLLEMHPLDSGEHYYDAALRLLNFLALKEYRHYAAVRMKLQRFRSIPQPVP